MHVCLCESTMAHKIAGEIVFENVSAFYRPDLPCVLKEMSCRIRANEKVRITVQLSKTTNVQILSYLD